MKKQIKLVNSKGAGSQGSAPRACQVSAYNLKLTITMTKLKKEKTIFHIESSIPSGLFHGGS